MKNSFIITKGDINLKKVEEWSTETLKTLANWVVCLSMVRETRIQSPGRVIAKTQKMLLDTALLNT